MRDMLAEGLLWLTGQLSANAAQEVRYARGAASVVVPATFGKKLLKLDDGAGGIRMERTDLDFLIPAASLVLDGVPFTPERGDTVYVDAEGGTSVYEVAPYGGDPPWLWSDPHRSMIRIHTKLVELEASF